MAWVTLLLWGRSPYGRYLDHGDWTEAGYAASLCQSLPAGEWLLPLTLYAGGWLLMSAAMMLPTALPLISALSPHGPPAQPTAAASSALLIGGYLAVWLGFGVAAHALDAGVHAVAARSAWLTLQRLGHRGAGHRARRAVPVLRPQGLLPRSLPRAARLHPAALAGCASGAARRSPLGVNHGLYCVGCCWALMLLMFVVGTASVGWMLVLGAVMAAEKALPFGRRLSHPLGLALLGWAGIIVAANLA